MKKLWGIIVAAILVIGCATTAPYLDTRWSVNQTTIAKYYITKTTEDCTRCTFPMPQEDDLVIVKVFEEDDALMNVRIMWFEENAPMIGIHLVPPANAPTEVEERCFVLEFPTFDAMGDFCDLIGEPQITGTHRIPCDGFLNSLERQLYLSEQDHDGREPDYRGE
jgi:hypothetical protein